MKRGCRYGILVTFVALGGAEARAVEFRCGVARRDITPEEPVRLTGYASRKTESEGVAQRIWAKALALEAAGERPIVLVTVDNCGVCAPIVEEVARRLKEKKGVARERLAVCSSHTHSAPMTRGFAPNIFVSELPAAEEKRIEDYSDRLTDHLESVVLAALEDLKPARIGWNEGRVCFAKNRRTPGGPVDYALPVLVVQTPEGGVRAVVANYACHCTTLGGEFNRVHGDWAGCAQEEIEKALPGSLAMITVGCGADANPQPRGKLEMAEQHGRELAREAVGLTRNQLRPLTAPPRCELKRLSLPHDPLPPAEEWERRTLQEGILGYLARRKLALIRKNEPLPNTVPFMAQTWTFGDDLAQVFLSGEVVVDYAKRLKDRWDERRLWVTAYANDVPCYIPSRRILAEGGYEAESSLWYYDRPARLASETEDLIVGAIDQLMPAVYRAEVVKTGHPKPLAPAESQSSIRVGGGLQVELVACEPLVVDPIAIDWDARGALWVLEMGDYPQGVDGKGKPGGRVLRLDDRDGDGRPDHSTEFLAGLAFPTGLFCAEGGIYICAAPDIVFAVDTDGDGRADRVEKRFTGFPTSNYNARMNGLSLGLDHWIYGAGGLLGGKIEPGAIDISGRDFRFDPASGAFEPATGLSQQGRVRDDWGNWFGCDNSNLLWHYPMPDDKTRRNPRAAPPASRVAVATDPDPNRLYPTSRTLERFNEAQMANRTTSACGIAIYRDDWLGSEFYGNAFTCEPVHNLVRRQVLSVEGLTIRGHRAADELEREFLSSRDNWSRFVQARTGPDGALWIVDMYRLVIEHPTWIPPEKQREYDLRAGADRGRIYRVRAAGKPLRAVRDLTALTDAGLAAAIDTRNGTERDRVHLEVLRRKSGGAAAGGIVRGVSRESDWPATRTHALCVLDAIGEQREADISHALRDTHPGVRREAVRLSARFGMKLEGLAEDPAAPVRFQVALESSDPSLLARLLRHHADDPWMRAAVVSSSADVAGAVLRELVGNGAVTGLEAAIDSLGASCQNPREVIDVVWKGGQKSVEAWQARLLAGWIEGGVLAAGDVPDASAVAKSQAEAGDVTAMRLAAKADGAVDWLMRFIGSSAEAAAFEELGRLADHGVPDGLLARWPQMGPATRSRTIRVLMMRESWHDRLVAAVRSGQIHRAEIPLADRQRLVRGKPAAAEWLTNDSASPAAVDERLKRFAGVEGLRGDSHSGSAVFDRLCATCHELEGVGHHVGPDLSAFRVKPDGDWLRAIVAPNEAIEPAFVGYEVTTNDGRVRAGVMRDETSTGMRLVQPGGASEVLLRSAVRRVNALPVSLMPEGLEAGLSPQDAADLLAWVRKPAVRSFGSSTPADAARVREEFLRDALFRPVRVIAAAGHEPYPGWLGPLPMHYCRQQGPASRLVWECAAPAPDKQGDCRFKFPVALGYISQPAGSFRLHMAGGGPLEFDVSLASRAWTDATGQIRANYTVEEANDEDSCGTLVLAVPQSMIASGKSVRFEVHGSDSNSQRWFGIYTP